MRAVRRLCACAAVSVAAVWLSLPAAFAQSAVPTTPIPPPKNPGQPPYSAPSQTPNPVVGDAGTLVGVLRVLPGSLPTDSILNNQVPLPKQSVAELGLGRAIVQVNSTAFLAHERSVAEASPAGVAIAGDVPQSPVDLAQAAVPDNAAPATRSFGTPADQPVTLQGPAGTVHARWSEQTGPCGVAPLGDAQYSLGGATVSPDLPMGGLPLGKPLLEVGQGAQAHSRVELAPISGKSTQAVQSTSTLSMAEVTLLGGTPQEVKVEVAGTPTLTATATGDQATSTVDYEAPVLRVSRGGQELGVVDAAHPQLEVPNVIGGNGIRLRIGALTEERVDTEIRAKASLFNLELLPDLASQDIAQSLAQVSFGEQVARAAAPKDGVNCPAAGNGVIGAPPIASGPPQSGGAQLALTSGAYSTVPLFWTGTALLLAGAILLAALPRRNHP